MTEIDWVRVTPTDLWPGYEGPDELPPDDDEERALFYQARAFDVAHLSVPPMYRNAFELPRLAFDWAQRTDDFGTLLFWGPPGTGKTHSAATTGCLVNAVGKQSLAFHSAHPWLSRVKNWGNHDDRENAIWDGRRPGVLVLDDLGRTKLTEVDVESLAELFDVRMMASKRTIVTTNLLPEDFDEVFGAHLTSRLLFQATEVPVLGADRRRK